MNGVKFFFLLCIFPLEDFSSLYALRMRTWEIEKAPIVDCDGRESSSNCDNIQAIT